MDRDQAIGADGAQTAKEIMENELVMQTDAYKNGKIIYLGTSGSMVHCGRRNHCTGCDAF